MRASDLLPESKGSLPQRLCRDFEAIRYLKSKVVFDRLIAAEWLKPVTHEHRLMLFDYHDLDTCIDRMKDEGGMPAAQDSSTSSSRGDR